MYPSSEMARSGKIYIHTWLGKVRDGEKKGPLLLSPLVEIFKGAFDGFNNIWLRFSHTLRVLDSRGQREKSSINHLILSSNWSLGLLLDLWRRHRRYIKTRVKTNGSTLPFVSKLLSPSSRLDALGLTARQLSIALGLKAEQVGSIARKKSLRGCSPTKDRAKLRREDEINEDMKM